MKLSLVEVDCIVRTLFQFQGGLKVGRIFLGISENLRIAAMQNPQAQEFDVGMNAEEATLLAKYLHGFNSYNLKDVGVVNNLLLRLTVTANELIAQMQMKPVTIEEPEHVKAQETPDPVSAE